MDPRLPLALLLTWILELGAARLIAGGSWRALAWPVLLVNAVTNPLANAACRLGGIPVLPVEACVVLAEVPLYALLLGPGLSWHRAAGLSLAANVLSAAAGGLILAALSGTMPG